MRTGDQPGGLGQHHVLYSGRPLVLGLDLLRLFDHRKYTVNTAINEQEARLSTTDRATRVLWFFCDNITSCFPQVRRISPVCSNFSFRDVP